MDIVHVSRGPAQLAVMFPESGQPISQFHCSQKHEPPPRNCTAHAGLKADQKGSEHGWVLPTVFPPRATAPLEAEERRSAAIIFDYRATFS
jgi:hypothetical protein